MGYKLLTTVLCLVSLRVAEGTTPTITDGTTCTQSKDLAETTTAGASAFTLTSSIAALYTLGGTDAASFGVTPTTGTGSTTATITITSAPVYATKTSYSLTVIVADASSAPDTTTATVAVNVIKRPAFTATTFTISPCDGTTAATAVTSLIATGHTGRTLVYAISSGNTNTDFSISTSTGLISVATGKTLSRATTSTYTLVVTASDSTAPAQVGTATATINILSSGSAAITGSLVAWMCVVFSILQKTA